MSLLPEGSGGGAFIALAPAAPVVTTATDGVGSLFIGRDGQSRKKWVFFAVEVVVGLGAIAWNL